MSDARHARSRSRWTTVAIVVLAIVLLGGAAFAAVRLTSGDEVAGPPATMLPTSIPTAATTSHPQPTTAPPPPAPATPEPTTAPSPSAPATTEPTTDPTTGAT